MTNASTVTKEDSFKERALQILNLRYLVKSDIKSSYKKRIFEYHPDRHPKLCDNPHEMREFEKKVMVVNQAYELLLDVLNGVKIDVSKYCLLEDTELVQSVLPENVKPAPLGKTEQELWIEKYGNLI
jgi:hypothetical protein